MNQSKVGTYLVIAALSILTSAVWLKDVSAEVSLTIKNNSQWTLQHLYLSDVNSAEWGPDQLGDNEDDVIGTGDAFTLTQIEEGNYDVKLVDEDGDECVVEDVAFSANDAVKITDELLLGCQAGTAEEEE